ncbi:MAG: transposase [Actinomycetes bacterium]
MSTASRYSSAWRRRRSRPTPGTTSSPTSPIEVGAPRLLGISDGAAGLTGAFDRAFPTSLRQRCLVHRARNVLAQVSAHDHDEVRADFWATFDVGDAEPGDEAVAVARRQAAAFAAKWQRRYPPRSPASPTTSPP